MDLPEYTQWQPLSVYYIQSLLGKLDWILAGGIALEQFLGYTYRPHGDIDILIKREDQYLLKNYISSDRIFVADGQGHLLPYQADTYYTHPIQDIWILDETHTSWCLQIMLIDVKNSYWVYKRNNRVQLPYTDIFFEKDRLKILKPEIQLLYKSKTIRDKDQLDFEKVFPQLAPTAKQYLQNSLTICYGDNHPWLQTK
ncbi:hypothetical protein QNI16_21800 [Cytophagaceae bacterium YF14B1]|uniref:Amino acid transporter n=1 Tax=Xanthocytophaga flava TaxID=3048013 RepID=A0AAE3QPL9_9BACT|nr:hypothetical protein [Xanthocytophaga flavus]MDJ1483147.1 hypothetical protein [Xanthocytophaga flavus]